MINKTENNHKYRRDATKKIKNYHKNTKHAHATKVRSKTRDRISTN